MSKRLNVGCGPWLIAGYINIDEDPALPAEMHLHVPPLPFEDGECEQVWAGHFLEHLTHDKATEFLWECYRVLEPGGTVGIVVPDTREIMRRYLAGAIDAVGYSPGIFYSIADLDDVCALFLYSTVQESRHQWSYDQDTLARALVDAGFSKLRELDRYRDPRIAFGAWYQVGLEGVKA